MLHTHSLCNIQQTGYSSDKLDEISRNTEKKTLTWQMTKHLRLISIS